jgi:hypothetical protein
MKLGLHHIFIQLGLPCPSHASFIARSSCPHLRGNSSLGTNVTILGQAYEYLSWHHFRNSQAIWWSSFTCQRSMEVFVTLVSQRGGVPTQVRARRPEGEGGKTWKIFSPKLSFLDIYIYIYIYKLAHPFFGIMSPVLVHICFTPSEGPKGF